jgi:hypothetical protein
MDIAVLYTDDKNIDFKISHNNPLLSDLWDVGHMGCRTYGMSDIWDVGLMTPFSECRTYDSFF